MPPPKATADAKSGLVQMLGLFSLRHLSLLFLENLSPLFRRSVTHFLYRGWRQVDFQEHAHNVRDSPLGQKLSDPQINRYRGQNRAELDRPLDPCRKGGFSPFAALRTNATMGSILRVLQLAILSVLVQNLPLLAS